MFLNKLNYFGFDELGLDVGNPDFGLKGKESSKDGKDGKDGKDDCWHWGWSACQQPCKIELN